MDRRGGVAEGPVSNPAGDIDIDAAEDISGFGTQCTSDGGCRAIRTGVQMGDQSASTLDEFWLTLVDEILEVDFFAVVLSAFVDGTDDGDGLARFHGRGARLAAFGDGGDHFFEVALMLIEVDRRRVVGSESGFLTTHVVGEDVGIDGVLLHEVPDFKGFVSEESGAFGAGQLHPGRMTIFRP